MTPHNINNVTSWFQVLETTTRSQTAVMTLTSGRNSSEEMNVHRNSDQVLLLLEGELEAEVGDRKFRMKSGDSCIVPAGTPHRFENKNQKKSVTFNVYSPPEYPANEKG